MIKILEKIRYFFFGERTVTEKGELLLKNKNLSDNEKFFEILKIYSDYLNSNGLAEDIAMAVLELSYEEVCGNPERYTQISKSIEKNQYYVICTQFVQQVKKLKNIDKNLCNQSQLDFLKTVDFFYNDVYVANFDYTRFYFDDDFNEKVNNMNLILIEKLKKYSAEKANINSQEETCI